MWHKVALGVGAAVATGVAGYLVYKSYKKPEVEMAIREEKKEEKLEASIHAHKTPPIELMEEVLVDMMDSLFSYYKLVNTSKPEERSDVKLSVHSLGTHDVNQSINK